MDPKRTSPENDREASDPASGVSGYIGADGGGLVAAFVSPETVGAAPQEFRMGRTVFRRARSHWELEQAYRLNYQTFVQEIPQHHETPDGRLVDKFDSKNVYFVALRNHQVVGMVAVHDQPPFSIAGKMADATILDSLGPRPLEVRLLAIEPKARHSRIAYGLMWVMYCYAREGGYSHLLISGVSTQQSLYEAIGFMPLGPARQDGAAAFVPMWLNLANPPKVFPEKVSRWQDYLAARGQGEVGQVMQLLPGPVRLAAPVARAWAAPSIYHRSHEFIEQFERTRTRLAEIVGGGMSVATVFGSGTLANGVIATTLAADSRLSRGLVLVNGEFGRRLTDHVARAGLAFDILEWDWGKPWDLEAVRDVLAREPRPGWVWGVHLETSTGVLNDLGALVKLARPFGTRVCADCISSIGAVELPAPGLYLASGVSGKCLGAVAGVGMVFADRKLMPPRPEAPVAACLDLWSAMDTIGPQFTFPSPQMAALDKALDAYDTPAQRQEQYRRYGVLGMVVRQGLRAAGLKPLADEVHAAPVITTFFPPAGAAHEDFLAQCRRWGYEIAGASEYLRRRGLVQIATMGDFRPEDCLALLERLSSHAASGPDDM
ncbi:MAG: aminotransferase class V-fold PLP-dependent enzyme [Planctomycetota bacterium]|nr:aminotransferase class V-fold PLP-dependent enzyme [Planctomycetota bacterium]